MLAGDVAGVRSLLGQGAELGTLIGSEDWGKHPLHAAVANGHTQLVRLMLDQPDPQQLAGMPAGSPVGGPSRFAALADAEAEPPRLHANTLDYACDPPLWHAVENDQVGTARGVAPAAGEEGAAGCGWS